MPSPTDIEMPERKLTREVELLFKKEADAAKAAAAASRQAATAAARLSARRAARLSGPRGMEMESRPDTAAALRKSGYKTPSGEYCRALADVKAAHKVDTLKRQLEERGEFLKKFRRENKDMREAAVEAKGLSALEQKTVQAARAAVKDMDVAANELAVFLANMGKTAAKTTSVLARPLAGAHPGNRDLPASLRGGNQNGGKKVTKAKVTKK